MKNMLEKTIPFPPADVPRPHVVTGRELPTYSPSLKKLAIELALNSRLVLVPGYTPSHWPYISLYGRLLHHCRVLTLRRCKATAPTVAVIRFIMTVSRSFHSKEGSNALGGFLTET